MHENWAPAFSPRPERIRLCPQNRLAIPIPESNFGFMFAAAPYPKWELFRPEHTLTLIVTALLAILTIAYARRAPNSRGVVIQTRILGVILLLTWVGKTITYPLAGHAIPLPMYLCDWAGYAGAFALLTRRIWLVELSYFWGLGAAIHGLLTPDLLYGFPYPVWFSSVHLHVFSVLAAFYVVLGLRLRPSRFAVWRVIAISHVYLLAAWISNLIVPGYNFGLLEQKPRIGSITEFFPDEPWHFIAFWPLSLVVFGLLYLPFWILRRKEQKRLETI
ncbi:MAG: putative integral membrane protein (TIGR02206 family) [Verrucomicrobiales bacterium]|jgi:hypothetical integral membrane protein (TIGR02206 family)